MRSPQEKAEVVERAVSYPYEIPERSFLQAGDETRELPSSGLGLPDRTPVLAFGSNAAPEVLARKFEPAEDDWVPVLRAELDDFDVVYSAHISTYGSIPAAILPSPGTAVSTFITYLTDGQLEIMSTTEPNYDLLRLDGIKCRLETGETLTSLSSYVSKHGCLSRNGKPIALARIPARNRQFQAMSEREAIEYVRSLLSPAQRTNDFIAENVDQPRVAKSRTRNLSASAIDFHAASPRGS